MKRKILTTAMIRPTADAAGTSAVRRAAMMLLMMMLTTATAWATDVTAVYALTCNTTTQKTILTRNNGNGESVTWNFDGSGISPSPWAKNASHGVDDEYDITFKPDNALALVGSYVQTSGQTTFTVTVGAAGYYIKSATIGGVTATAGLNAKSLTVTVPDDTNILGFNVTLTDDFYGTVTPTSGLQVTSSASVTEGGTKYYKAGTTVTVAPTSQYDIVENPGGTGSASATVADDRRSFSFTMPDQNVSPTATLTEVHTISCPSDLPVNSYSYFSYNSTDYYKKGETYTLTIDAGKAITSFTATGAASSSVADDKCKAYVTIGSSDVTVTATVQTISGTTAADGLRWRLAQDDNGDYTRLTINGLGEMTDYGHKTVDGLWRTDAPWGYGLTSVFISGGVTKIGTQAFIGCQHLATVTIDTGVTTIGNNAFDHCDALTQITLPTSVTTLNDAVFKNCSGLQRVDIGYDGAVSLGSNVFQNCNALQYIVFSSPEAAQANTTGNWSGLAEKFLAKFGDELFSVTKDKTGTAAYKIATADDLRNLAAAVNAENDGSGKTFLQTAPIDLKSGGNFPTIGVFTSPGEYFSGTYDGGGNTISGLTVNISSQYAGLFGEVYGGTVKNIILVSPKVTSTDNSDNNIYVGAIAGFCDQATIENCHAVSPTVSATGTGSGDKRIGALFGNFDTGNTATNCYYYGGNQSNAIGLGDGTLTNVTSAQLLTLSDGVNIQNTMSPELGFSYDADGNGTPENYWRTGAKLTLSGLPTDDSGEGYQYVYTATAGTVSDSQYTVGNQDATLGYALLITEWSGEGNQDSPYIIQYPSQLLLLAYRVNGTHGETANEFSGTYFKLGADIAFEHADNEGDDYAENYEAIGGGSYYFKGNFDGDHKTVSGIRICKPGTGHGDRSKGLFGGIKSPANIHDVYVTDARIRGDEYVSGIAGYNGNGTISGCIVTNSVFSVTTTKNRNYGIISGDNWGSYSHNYYHGCTMNGEAVTSGMGCGERDLTTNDGAVPMPVLSDTGSNADAIATLATRTDQGQYPVVLEGRTLSKSGEWNTLCLPFSLGNAEAEDGHHFDGTPLEGAIVKEMDDSENESGFNAETGVLTLKFTTASSIEAGKPYIVKWEGASGSVSDPVFEGVTISSTEPEPVTSYDGKVTFVGQYSPFEIVESGATGDGQGNLNEILMLGSGSTLGYSKNPRTLRCFRCHFYVPVEGGEPGAREFVLNFDDENTTGIISPAEIKEITEMAGAWYSIDGRKLDTKPTAKGVYIRGGKKVIIK